MELFKLLGTIAVENGEAIKALKDTQQEGEKTESKLGKFFSSVGKGAAVAGKAIATGLAAGATAMAGLTVKALQASGDLEQNMGGAEAVFGELGKTIGDMKTPMQVFNAETGKVETQMSSLEAVSKEAYKNMGLSQSDYLATANKMGALFKGAGFETQEALDMSSQAMQRAADVASIMGIDTESAMEAVAGAAKGNFTMMDNLGVAMNDTAIAAYAASKGINKSTSEMSQQEKIGLAMEMFLDKTSYAAGNYAKENETLAGSLGTAKSALTNFLSGSGDVESLVSSFSNLANVVVKSLKEIAPRLTQGISDLVQQISPMIEPLLQTLLPVLVDGAVSLVNGLVAALPGIINALLAAIPALIDGILQIADALIGALPQIIQALVSALPTLIPQLIDGVVSLIMMLVEMLPQIIDPLIAALPTIIISIVEALVNNLPVLIEGLIQLIMGIVTAIPQIIQALVDAIPTIVSLLVEAVLGNLPAIIMGLIQVVMGIVTALPQIFGSLISAVPAALSGIWDGIKKVFGNLGSWFGDKFKGAKDAAVKAWDGAKEKWNSIKEKCVNGFSNLKDKVGTKFSEAKNKAVEKWNDAKTKFSSVKDKVVGAFSNLKDKVSPLFSKAKDNATKTWSTVKGSFEKIKNGDIVGAFSDMGSLLKGKFSNALNLAKQGFSKIKDIGKDLVKGLWNGINNAKDWVLGKIKGFGKGILNGLKSFFGIKSPSRVMRDQVGRELANGVAVGITANADKAEDASEKLAKNILDAAQNKLDTFKTFNDMTLAEEAGFWDAVRVQLKEGTDARLQADQKYYEAKKSINEQVVEAEKTLQDSLAEIYQKLADRKSEILGTFSLFDEYTDGNAVPKTQMEMLNALDSQIAALEVYDDAMATLEARIGGSALFEELAGMGIGALSQIQQINSMTDIQLQMYADKYAKRAELASKMAEDELSTETFEATQKAYQTFADACGVLGVEVVSETSAMQQGVTNALDKIKQAFETFQPKMKMPHFKIEGTLDIESGSVPSVAVEWYKKAMSNAAILNKPTIFGYSASSGKYLGAGEAGNEVVAGEQTLMNMIQGAVATQNSGIVAWLQRVFEILAQYFPQMLDALEAPMSFDSNSMAAALAVPMNRELGKISSRKERGRG